MFGYITVHQDELKIKDFKKYQSYYCGVCQELKERHGMASQTTLTYDMTFLAILLCGLYEEKEQTGMCRCLMHPGKKHPCRRSPFTAYAADMNILLSYYNLLDDWYDERKVVPFTLARLIHPAFVRVTKQYPRQTKAVRRYMKRLGACEASESADLDLAAGYTGELFGEIFVCREDMWQESLRKTGFYLGKFIYLMDAYEDIDSDKKSGNYNPWLTLCERAGFAKSAKEILTMMAAECSREFEKLPIVENVDILRNILYSGIWVKYDVLEKKSKENNKC